MKISEVKTLSELQKLLKIRKRNAVNSKKSLYRNMNKDYKKVDWRRDYIPSQQAKQILNDPFYKCWRRLYADKETQPIISKENRNIVTYKTQNIQGLCLLKQLAALQQNKYFSKSRVNKSKDDTKFYFNSAYMGQIFLFSYPKSREWKAELLTEFLKTKEFLFDEDSPYWKGLDQLKYFLRKYLMNCKVERWDYNLQRFLTKED